MRLSVAFVSLCVLACVCHAADVYRGRFRSINRLNPSSPRGSRSSLFGLSLGNSRRYVVRRRKIGTTSDSVIGPASALRAGEEGAYDFSDQYNAIIPDRNAVKPTKQPPQTNTNKINIESKVTLAKENDTVAEKVFAQNTAIMHCTFDEVDQIGTYSQAKIWWTKLSERAAERPVILAAGTQVRVPDDRLKIITFPDNTYSILVIRNVLPEDAGQYKCSLPTVSGTKTRFTSLKVLEAPSEMISISPKETTLNAGENLNLFCQPSDSSLGVWWTAKDANGNNIDVIYGFDRVAGRTLNIADMQRSQAGIYTCHIENSYGSPIHRHFTVTVKEKPWEIEAYIGGFQMNTLLAKFYRDPVYGDNVNLRCDTGGVPIPAITWYKDGRLLEDSYKHSISSFNPTYKDNSIIARLTVKGFQSYDNGVYTCRATNDAGSSEQSFSINGRGSEDALDQSDDEDYGTAALRGRKGRIVVKTCKGGRDCTPISQGYDGSGYGDDQE